MTRERVRALLLRVASGEITPESALDELSKSPVETLDFATIDHHRSLRQGIPEVVYGAGKTAAQVVHIAERIGARGDRALITRADEPIRAAVRAHWPDARINDLARTAIVPAPNAETPSGGPVLIITAGTSDLPVAEEAGETLFGAGVCAERLTDVGVAGIHRLLARSDALYRARTIIVIAGMDGALPSVVGGLVACPVVAVPTSVGYGASFGGIAALLTMLNSCAAGVTVVNIDNGFGAAVAALRLLNAPAHGA
ncbi:MAG TPA: nickel pincer cofactor biosynthesis protein LarB [Gemmatimonadaceae bacterium]|nr:nickel pincer cofactor biosynthesis protein LarB [Gemmatimonadaceae bacterium]